MNELSAIPRGFAGITSSFGIKDETRDFMLVVSTVPCASAAVFTQSLFAGPGVSLGRTESEHGAARGIVAVSKNANVANGDRGLRDARELRDLAARHAGIEPRSLLVASTGVIGRPYPMERIRDGLASLPTPLPDVDFDAVAEAIMTTDTRSKKIAVRCGDATIVGVAKGVGMIEPDMATLLTFFFTDAQIEATQLDEIFRRVVSTTFNAVSIDTDTSTSDTAAVFANGLAGPVPADQFESALHECALSLVKDIASDGEGATKLIEVKVSGAIDAAQAKRAGKAVVNSPLVKTAVHGADPNWGRIAMAIGKLNDPVDAIIEPENVAISIGFTQLYPGPVTEAQLADTIAYLEGDDVTIAVDLGVGSGSFTVYGCDLSAEYVEINTAYTT